MTTVEIDTSVLNRRCDELAQAMNACPQKMARWGMQRALTMILKLSPPKTQKQGRDSIEANLQRGLPLLSSKSLGSERLKRAVDLAIKNTDGELLTKLLPRYMRNKKLVPFYPYIYRESVDKYGRARRGKFITTDAKRWHAYQKKLNDNVGKLRGGWNAASQRVGVAARDVKAFAAKHGTSGGIVIEVVAKSSAKVTGINRSNYVPPDKFQGQINAAMRYAEKNMMLVFNRVLAGMRKGKDPRTLFSADVFKE